jgi:SpoVK/Ycf46/Vps4 family AAA+-type ATPase
MELVDRAFLRPGRFERTIYVGPLEKQKFSEFFEREIRNCDCDISDDEWEQIISKMVDEATGADLHGLVNTAKRNAVSNALEEGSDSPILSLKHMMRALHSTPHLFSGFVNKIENQDDWDNDDDDWVIP